MTERGLNSSAANSIRDDLEQGRLVALIVDAELGDVCPVVPDQWRASTGAAHMLWSGSGKALQTDGNARRLGTFQGDIYLTTPLAEPEAAVKSQKSADLGTRERTTVYKMLLAAMVDGYGYRPRRGTTAASELASATKRMFPDGGVSEETIRSWLRLAIEELGDPIIEQP
jgi:hypothetical protein